MPWRSQVTCPWLSLVVFFRIKVQLFREICSAVTLGLMDGRSPLSFEMVRTTSAFSSHTITVHWELLLQQVNRASSPCRTVSVSGASVTWAAAAMSQRGPVSINKHVTEQEHELHTLKPQINVQRSQQHLDWVNRSRRKKAKNNGPGNTSVATVWNHERAKWVSQIYFHLISRSLCVPIPSPPSGHSPSR